VKTFLFDASVWLAALDSDDAQHLASLELLRSAQRNELSLAALDLSLYEVSNVAAVGWSDAAAAHQLVNLIAACCAQTTATVSAELLRSATEIAQRNRITVYDAAYAAAAAEHGWQLVSCDVRDMVSNRLALTPAVVVASISK
jgi:predicted nucleic acid-binding protein